MQIALAPETELASLGPDRQSEVFFESGHEASALLRSHSHAESKRPQRPGRPAKNRYQRTSACASSSDVARATPSVAFCSRTHSKSSGMPSSNDTFGAYPSRPRAREISAMQ